MNMERRIFLKNSALGASLWAIYSCMPESRPSHDEPSRKITLSHQNVLKALIPIFLGPKSFEVYGHKDLDGFLTDLEKTISGLPRYTQKEVFLLFDLLQGRVTRFVITGIWSPFSQCTREELESALLDWSGSSLGLRRNAYEGLRDLILGTWYAHPSRWAQIGYPGVPIL